MEREYIFNILISNIIASLVAATLFHYKGRGFWNGFVYGLLLGWLVVLFALFMSSDQEGIFRQEFNRGKIALCPNCGEYIKPDSAICKYCREPLSSATIIRQLNKPRTGLLKTKILPSIGFFVGFIGVIFTIAVFVMASTIWQIAEFAIGFAVAVTIAELPSFQFGRTVRGFIAGILFVLPGILSKIIFERIDILLILLILLVAVGSGILASLAIDWPRFRWRRALLFTVAGLASFTYYDGLIEALWLIIFLSLGYALVPRDSDAFSSEGDSG